jgi:hypothetical protein
MPIRWTDLIGLCLDMIPIVNSTRECPYNRAPLEWIPFRVLKDQ